MTLQNTLSWFLNLKSVIFETCLPRFKCQKKVEKLSLDLQIKVSKNIYAELNLTFTFVYIYVCV